MSTQRTKAELDALFPTNMTRNITAAKIRDFIESCKPSYGHLHFHDPGSATVIAAPSTYVKAGNVSHLHSANRFSMPANNRLLYDGDAVIVCNILSAFSFLCAVNNQILAFAIAINGVVNAGSVIRAKIGTGTDIQAATVAAQVILNPGDYAELWVANDTSAGNVTIDHGIVQVTGFLS